MLQRHPFQDFSHISEQYDQEMAGHGTYEAIVTAIEDDLTTLVRTGNFMRFVNGYVDHSRKLLENSDTSVLKPLLADALKSLLSVAAAQRLRTRQHFAEKDSVYRFDFPVETLADARRAVDEMEGLGTTNQDYELRGSPVLLEWVNTVLKPLIEGYVGFKVSSPAGELRFHDSAVHSKRWEDVYRHHPFANFHFDRSMWAFPFIVYLDDVAPNCGPFSYVNGTDKQPQNYVLRSFHSAATHVCKLRGSSDDDFATLGKLPSIFRGGDLVGTFAGPKLFDGKDIVEVTGPAGTGVLFHGFHLVHSGGNPSDGKRKALFVSFRYPRGKVHRLMGGLAARYWDWRIS